LGAAAGSASSKTVIPVSSRELPLFTSLASACLPLLAARIQSVRTGWSRCSRSKATRSNSCRSGPGRRSRRLRLQLRQTNGPGQRQHRAPYSRPIKARSPLKLRQTNGGGHRQHRAPYSSPIKSRPKNTPAEIIDKLNKEVNAALADPKIRARLADLGGTVLAGSPANFGKLIAEETEKWGKVVKFSGAKAD
jgi:hypothetical protein